MAVYVDPLFATTPTKQWPYPFACHLTADTLEELHAFAVGKLKLRREWFQLHLSNPALCHYDLTYNKRRLAVSCGAIEVTGQEVYQHILAAQKKEQEKSTLSKNLYTFGYLSTRAERIIKELLAVKTPLVDIRYQPYSKHWQYTQTALQSRCGPLYYHLPDLGNEWYKEALQGKFAEPRIKLHNLKAGLAALENILQEHHRAALFCACSSKTKCHRILVAKLAQEFLQVQVHHL